MSPFNTWVDALEFIGIALGFGIFAGEVAALIDRHVNQALGRETQFDRELWRIGLAVFAASLAAGFVAIVGWGR